MVGYLLSTDRHNNSILSSTKLEDMIKNCETSFILNSKIVYLFKTFRKGHNTC